LADLLSSITATFDEQLRLLLDPHYHRASTPSAASVGSSSQVVTPRGSPGDAVSARKVVAATDTNWSPAISSVDKCSRSVTPDASSDMTNVSIHSTPSKHHVSRRGGNGDNGGNSGYQPRQVRKTVQVGDVGRVSALVSAAEKQCRRVSLGQEPMVSNNYFIP